MTPARPFPRLGKAALGVIGAGLLADLMEHTLVSHAGESVAAGFPLGEHAAHLVVLIGMVLLLAAVVLDGVGVTRGRDTRPERSDVDAIR